MSNNKLLSESARYLDHLGTRQLVEKLLVGVGDDVRNGLLTTEVKKAVNKHLKQHMSDLSGVIGNNTQAQFHTRELTLYPKGKFSPTREINDTTIRDNINAHNHYVEGVLNFFRGHGLDVKVRNAMPFDKSTGYKQRSKEYGSYPKTHRHTAIIHPGTGKTLMTVVAQYGGPYTKVSGVFGEVVGGHYYDKLGPVSGWPQDFWDKTRPETS